MTHSKHQHSKDHHRSHNHPQRKVHKDWRLWLAVVLMLLGMVIYVVTLDESVLPGAGNSKLPVPAVLPDAE